MDLLEPLLVDGRRFRVLAGLLVVGGLAISAYFRRQANSTRADVSGDDGPFKVLRIVGLVFLGVLLTNLVVPSWVDWTTVPLPTEVRHGGAALSAGALPMFIWVFRSLGGNVTPTARTRHDHELVTGGPYRWIRHPLYTFGVLFWAGICLLTANWLLSLLLGVAFTGIVLRTPLEEQELVEAFGDDYLAYMERTGRYVPRFPGGR
jgi:protein-S-isoprenylcysteine O-methyltransferase Ste14